MPITVADVREMLRADLVGLALGALLFLSGLLAVGLSAVERRRMAGPFYLGIFAFLYGLRLLARTDTFRVGAGIAPEFWEYLAAAITYTILIPAILFARTLEPSWRRLWNWVLVGLVAFAVYALASDAYLRQPNSAITLNNLLAMTFIVGLLARFFSPALERTRELRILQAGTLVVSLAALADNLRGMGAVSFPGPELEPFGFTIAIACLGVLAWGRISAEARRLVALDRELSIAREIQYSILPQSMPRVAGIDVAARYRPMTAVAGDFYDFLEIDEHRIGVLVADVSGHGVPAALIASMVKVALAAQRSCADRPGEVLEGMNRALTGKLAGRYVTAAYLFVDVSKELMRYAAAGHPPMLHVRPNGAGVTEIEQNGMLLGFFEDAAYETREDRLADGDRVLLYTDGLIEAENANEDFYGLDRAKAAFASASGLRPLEAADAMLHAMDAWSGLEARDDLTLVLVERGSGLAASGVRSAVNMP